MGIDTLTKLIPPPKTPFDIGTVDDWKKVKRELHKDLPDDFKAFIAAYGTGRIGAFIHIYNPHSRGSRNLLSMAGSLGETVAEEDDFAEFESAGLMPWAEDENGNYYFWHTKGKPNAWTVVTWEPRGLGLIDHGCSMTEYLIAIFRGEAQPLGPLREKTFDPIEEKPSGNWLDTQLCDALFKGRPTKLIKELLEQGANPNASNIPMAGVPAIFFASKSNAKLNDPSNVERAQLLIKHGANYKLTANAGETVLFGPVRGGELDLLKYYLSLGVDVNAREEDGMAAIDGLSIGGRHAELAMEMLVVLLDAGADVNSQGGHDNNTLMHRAINYFDVTAIEYLFKRGANPNLRNSDGLTSLGRVRKEIKEQEISDPEHWTIPKLQACAKVLKRIGGKE